LSKVLVIGAGGVGSVAVHKMAMNAGIFSDIRSPAAPSPNAMQSRIGESERTGQSVKTYARSTRTMSRD
jgi:saccharopine dehydrogenase (NAD+, L-lysine-forming)